MAPKAKADTKAKKAKKEEEDDTPKMKEPDYTAYDESVKAIQDKIDKLQKEKEALQAKITERSSGKDGFQAQRAEIRGELDEISKQMDAIKEQRDKIKQMLGDKRAEGAALKEEMGKMKKSLGYTNVEDINARIAQINYKMQHESLTLKQEKDYMAEIKELNRDKPKLSQLSNLNSKLDNFDAGTDLREKQKELNEQFGMLYEKKKGVQEKFRELQDSRTAQEGDLGAVRDEKTAKQDKIRELIEERNKLRDAFNEEKRAYRVFQDEQRRKRQEAMAGQRKAEAEERQRARLERQVEALDDQPYVEELARVEQCTRYCKTLVPDEAKAEAEEKKETVFNNKDNEVVLLKKDDRNDEGIVAATKVKAKKSSKKKGGGDASKQKITLNMDSFKDWAFLGLPPPMFLSDIPELLTKLEEKKKHFEQKVKDWEENKEELKRKILAGEIKPEDLRKDDDAGAPAAEEGGADDYPVIKYGAEVPESITSEKMEKKMKKIIKEGGKRGVEIEGAADMGGLQFFCTSMDEPGGDADLLYESMKAMNAFSDPTEEERKGGSGRIGKMLISKNQEDSKLALVTYCPPAKHGELKADQWMKDVLKALGGGELLFGDAFTAKAMIQNDADKGLFVLKLKDSAITESINYLKGKGLFPDKADDSDDDYVFGDEDFPQ